MKSIIIVYGIKIGSSERNEPNHNIWRNQIWRNASGRMKETIPKVLGRTSSAYLYRINTQRDIQKGHHLEKIILQLKVIIMTSGAQQLILSCTFTWSNHLQTRHQNVGTCFEIAFLVSKCVIISNWCDV